MFLFFCDLGWLSWLNSLHLLWFTVDITDITYIYICIVNGIYKPADLCFPHLLRSPWVASELRCVQFCGTKMLYIDPSEQMTVMCVCGSVYLVPITNA